MLELNCWFFFTIQRRIMYSVEVIQLGSPEAQSPLPQSEFGAGKIEFPRDPDIADPGPISSAITTHRAAGPKATTVSILLANMY